MFNIANTKACFVKLSTNLNKLINENEISQRINNIARNLFTYFHKNQNALRAGIWSYLLIEASVFASEVISSENSYDLETCQNIVCNIWNDQIENREFFSPAVEFRCDSSHSNYHPFYFLKKCMVDLCNYGKNIELPWEECSNFNENPEELFSAAELWNGICPKKTFRHNDIVKEITYINDCITSLCNYINLFQIKLDKNLYELCDNINGEKINEFLFKLSKVKHDLNIKIEDEDSWTSLNTIMSLAALTVTSTINLVGSINKNIVQCILKEPSNMPSRILGIRNIMMGILQNVQSLGTIPITTDELHPEEEEISKFFIDVQNSISELSDILDPTLSYLEHKKTIKEETIPDDDKIGVISSNSLLKALLAGPRITHSEVTEVLCGSKKFIQDFIDDYKFYNLEGHDITNIQVNRFKHCLQNWQNAFCYYSHQLFCRFPQATDTNSKTLLLPNEQMNCILSHLRALCYFLIDGLWCNWTLFLETLPETENLFAHKKDCTWDFVTLTIHHDSTNTNNYQIQALGDCYNQTSRFRV